MRRAGFSLLEVLLAVALLGAVLSALYGAFFSVQKALSRERDTLLAVQEAQRALDVLQRELEALTEGLSLLDKGTHRPASELSFKGLSPQGLSECLLTYRAEEGPDGALRLVKTLQDLRGQVRQAVLAEALEAFLVEAWHDGRGVRAWKSSTAPERLRASITLRDGTVLQVLAQPRIGRPL